MPATQQQLDEAITAAALDPVEMAGEPITDSRFAHGQALAVSGIDHPYELASNELEPRESDPNEMDSRAATSIWYIGQTHGLAGGVAIIRSGPFHLPAHGWPKGEKLWLGKEEIVCQQKAPEGPGVVLGQEIGSVIDADNINWEPKMAMMKEMG